MKAAIYNQYLDTLGGGERYSLAVATSLRGLGYDVDVAWEDASIKGKLEKRFGIDLRDISFVKDIRRGEDYDLCFWVSDGSIPTLRAGKNFLHFQVPFHDINGKSLINRMKLFRIKGIICNSLFTKKVIDKEYGVDSIVLYPPVNTEDIRVKRKEKMILFVGRFSQLKQSKNQDVLIRSFKKFFDAGFSDWRLILAGGSEVGAEEYVKELEQSVGSYPITIIKSPDYKILFDLYGKAKLFWSAVGYGEDEEKHPEKVEHFGISVVEAMAGGAIPLVFKAGGYKEIVSEDNGFFWEEPKDLIAISKTLCRKPFSVWKALIKNGIALSGKYSYGEFSRNFEKLI